MATTATLATTPTTTTMKTTFINTPEEIQHLMATTLAHAPCKVGAALLHRNQILLYKAQDPHMEDEPYMVFVDLKPLLTPGLLAQLQINERLLTLAYHCHLVNTLPATPADPVQALLVQGQALAGIEDPDFVWLSTT